MPELMASGIAQTDGPALNLSTRCARQIRLGQHANNVVRELQQQDKPSIAIVVMGNADKSKPEHMWKKICALFN